MVINRIFMIAFISVFLTLTGCVNKTYEINPDLPNAEVSIVSPQGHWVGVGPVVPNTHKSFSIEDLDDSASRSQYIVNAVKNTEFELFVNGNSYLCKFNMIFSLEEKKSYEITTLLDTEKNVCRTFITNSKNINKELKVTVIDSLNPRKNSKSRVVIANKGFETALYFSGGGINTPLKRLKPKY